MSGAAARVIWNVPNLVSHPKDSFTSHALEEGICLDVGIFEGTKNEPVEFVLKNTDGLSSSAQQLLGDNGVKRFHEFKHYKDGWDYGCGMKLSTRSVAVLELFLSGMQEFHVEPSLFFTRNGNLQLGWESVNGAAIEVEFYPDKIEYFIESISEESEIQLTDFGLQSLINKIRTA